MGIAQLDRVLTEQQIAAIVAFLNTLTGTYRGRAGAAGRHRTTRRPCAPMRNLAGALGISLLLALLTWLLLRGIDTNAPAYAMTLRAFDDYALAEASLHRDVLQARAGLLRDYDSLNDAAQAMEDAVTRLRSYAQTERLDTGPVDRLAAARRAAGRTDGAVQDQQRASAEFAVLCWPPEYKSGVSRPRCPTCAGNRRFGGRDPPSLARYIGRRRQGAPAADRPVCRAGAQPLDRTRKQHGRCWRMLVCCMTQLPAVDATLKAFIAVPSATGPRRDPRDVFPAPVQG